MGWKFHFRVLLHFSSCHQFITTTQRIFAADTIKIERFIKPGTSPGLTAALFSVTLTVTNGYGVLDYMCVNTTNTKVPFQFRGVQSKFSSPPWRHCSMSALYPFCNLVSIYVYVCLEYHAKLVTITAALSVCPWSKGHIAASSCLHLLQRKWRKVKCEKTHAHTFLEMRG